MSSSRDSASRASNRTTPPPRESGPAAGHKPPWLKVRLPGAGSYYDVRRRLSGLGVHTVCEEARCPNAAECWGSGTATFMILGIAARGAAASAPCRPVGLTGLRMQTSQGRWPPRPRS